MKFILSLIALFAFFAFALCDAAKGVHYQTDNTVINLEAAAPTQVADMTIAQEKTKTQKAGFSL